MQKKIGTLLDVDILQRAKERAMAQHTTLNHLFEQALSEYLGRESGSKRRFSTVETSFGAISLPHSIVQKIAQEEFYETE